MVKEWVAFVSKIHVHLPRKPFGMFHPRIISRLPATQASITAETLNIVIATWKILNLMTNCFDGHISKN